MNNINLPILSTIELTLTPERKLFSMFTQLKIGLFLWVLSLTVQAFDGGVLPSWKTDNILSNNTFDMPTKGIAPSPVSALSNFNNVSVAPANSMRSIATLALEPKIKALARALRNNTDEIYQFVYQSIDLEATYGLTKGALGALRDRSANAYDQAELLAALLVAAGKADVKLIEVTYDASWVELNSLLRIDSRLFDSVTVSQMVNNLLGRLNGSFQGTPDNNGIKGLKTVVVSLTEKSYYLNPSFKQYNRIIPLLDIGGAIGFSNKNFVMGTNLTRSQLREALKTASASLATKIKNDYFDKTVEQVLGDWALTSTVPTDNERYGSVLNTWTTVPSNYRTTLSIDYAGISETYYSDTIYGENITLFAGNRYATTPYIKLPGKSKVEGTKEQDNTTINFNVNHANSNGVGDDTWTQSVQNGGYYVIINGWGNVGKKTVNLASERLKKAIKSANTSSNDNEIIEAKVRGLELLGMNWIFDHTQGRILHQNIHNTPDVLYHTVGLAGTNDISGATAGPYVDIGSKAGASTLIHTVSESMLASAFEHGVIKHTQGNTAVSTAFILDEAAKGAGGFYEIKTSNLAETQEELNNYPLALSNDIKAYVGQGFSVLLPKGGNENIEEWSGSGFFSFYNGTNNVFSTTFSISGGYSGGYSTTAASIDTSFLDTYSQSINTLSTLVSDPIDFNSGHFLYFNDDISVGSGAGQLTFKRSYSSGSNEADGVLGLGWRHNLDVSVRTDSDIARGFGSQSAIDASQAIVAMYVSGKILENIETNLTGTVTSSATIYAWLMEQLTNNVVYLDSATSGRQFTKLADGIYNPPPGVASTLEIDAGNFKLTDKHGTVTQFNSDNKISTVTDRNDNTTTFSYTGEQLSSVTNSFGQTLTLAYENDVLKSVSDGHGRSVSYNISDGLLTGFTNALNKTTEFKYTTGNNLLEYVYTPEYPSTASPAYPQVFNVYNSAGQITEQNSSIDGLHYYYIATGYRSEEVGPNDESMVMYFDSNGKVLTNTNAEGHTTSHTYDGAQRLHTTTNPEGDKLVYGYDNHHNIISITQKSKPGPAPLADITNTSAYTEDFNFLDWKKDALGKKTDYTYDSNGNLKTITAPNNGNTENPVTTFTYTTQGLIETKVDPDGIKTKYQYYTDNETDGEVQGLLHKQILNPDPENLSANEVSKQRAITYTYYDNGDVKTVTNALNKTITYTFDKERRLKTVVAPKDIKTTNIYDANGRLTHEQRYSGDTTLYPAGKNTTTHPAGWAVTSYTYTRDDKVKTITDPAGDVITYGYNNVGDRTSIEDAEGRITKFSYINHKEETVKQNVGDTLTTTAEYKYTSNGLIDYLKDADGNITDYTYDGFNRQKTITYPDSSKEDFSYYATGTVNTYTNRDNNITTNLYYDNQQLKQQTIANEETRNYSYTDAGRLSSIKQHRLNATDSTTAHTINYAYIPETGELNTVTNANNQIVNYDYNNNGQRKSMTAAGITLAYLYDDASRLTDIKQGSTTYATYHYNTLSQVDYIDLGNGTTVDYSYENDGDLNELSHSFKEGGNLDYAYGYNDAGQINNKISKGIAKTWLPDSTKTVSFSPNNLNQYNTIGGSTVGYDSNGNLDNFDDYIFTHNQQNQLTGIEMSSIGHNVTMLYDGLGRRQSKSGPLGFTQYLYDGDHIIAEYDATGAVIGTFIYGASIDQPLALKRGGDTYFYHLDERNSVVALSESTGKLIEQYTYDPFGHSTDFEISAIDNPLGYTARRLDKDSGIGLYYYRARYYSPEWGSFIEADPIGYSDGLNMYGYVGHDPINFNDPNGLAGEFLMNSSSNLYNIGNAFTEASTLELGLGLGLDFKGKVGNSTVNAGGRFTVGTRLTGIDSKQGHILNFEAGYELTSGKMTSTFKATYGKTWRPDKGTVITSPFDIKNKHTLNNFSANDKTFEISGTYHIIRGGFTFDPNRFYETLKPFK